MGDGEEQTLSELYEGQDCDGYVRSVKYGRRTLYVEDLEWETERRPFRCNLDVGLKATTLGSRSFGALKGARDGGLDIPHSHKKFPGYNPEKKKYNAKQHVHLIYGGHVADYIKKMYEDAHAKIREDSTRADIGDENRHEAQAKK